MKQGRNGEVSTIGIHKELYHTALRTILETMGLTAALQILRPISEEFGRLSSRGRISGILPSKLDEITSYQCFLKELLFGTRVRGEMYERGARIKVSSCRLEGQYPEICFLCCKMMSEECTKAMNPRYDQVFLKSLSSGDAECEWVLIRRGETSFDLGAAVPFHRLTPNKGEVEAIRSLIPKMYVQSWMLITEAFLEKVGEEKGMSALQRSMHSLGMEKSEEYAVALGVEKEIESIGHLVERVFDLLEVERIEASDESRKKVTFPFSISSPAICLQIEAFCCGILEGINPDYDPAYDETMGKACGWCH